MSGQDLAALREIARLLHQRELARLAPILRDEARIRSDLARLDDVAQAARDSLHGPSPVTLTGADALWGAWVERQRTDLQSALARVLARKAEETHALRRAFGRMRAMEDLVEAGSAAERHDRQRRAAAALDALAALERSRR